MPVTLLVTLQLGNEFLPPGSTYSGADAAELVAAGHAAWDYSSPAEPSAPEPPATEAAAAGLQVQIDLEPESTEPSAPEPPATEAAGSRKPGRRS